MWQPRYRITDDIATKLTDIAQLRVNITVAQLLPAREAMLRRKAVIKIAQTSTSIEGNELKEDQVQALVEGRRINAEQRQIKEVENYLAALHYIDNLTQKQRLHVRDILKFHACVIKGLVQEDKTGQWRKGPVYIVKIPNTDKDRMVYTAPPAKEVPGLVNELLDWLTNADRIHPVLRAGLLHYQCASIHPFADGNGRTARLLTLLHLYQSDWAFRKILVLEDYYNHDRQAYYRALDTGSTYGKRQGVDLTGWLTYFIDGFWEEVVRVHEQILRLTALGKKTTQEARLGTEELRLIDFVVTMGKITSDDAVDILGIPKRTAQAKLQKLQLLKMLQKRRAGPATHYILNIEI